MSSEKPAYPVAVRRTVQRSFHDHTFDDHFEWLRDKNSDQVRAHLGLENEYAEAVTAHLQPLRERIYGEIKDRTQETDMSVPSRNGDWWYFARTVEGGAHQVFCRVPAVDSADTERAWTPPTVEPGVSLPGEETLLDANAASETHDFYALGSFSVSEDGTRLAWSEDTAGDERFTVYIKDLASGELLTDRITQTSYGAFLTPDASELIYTVVDDAWRPWRVYRHVIGTPVSEDELIYQEDNPGLWLGVELSADKQWLMVASACSEYGEYRIRKVDAPRDPWLTVIPESDRVLYTAEPITVAGADYVLLTHDYAAPNSRVSLMPLSTAGSSIADVDLIDVIPASEQTRIEVCEPTATHLVVSLRSETTPRVRLIPRASLDGLVTGSFATGSLTGTEPAFDEDLFTASVVSARYDNPVIRVSYTSFVTPPRVYDIPTGPVDDENLDEFGVGAPIMRRETTVLGGYNRSDYTVERDWAVAEDGTRIPISLVRRADFDASVPAPVVQYAYGSYEASTDPGFSISRLSLLDRGVAWVVAHVRGGGELGRSWYDDGKKFTKKNTFTDYVAVTRHLAQRQDVDAARIAVLGGSAGGLLVGAVLNLAPDLYCGALAAVPFVDPLTSMLMPELPLTALEWEEWGNPMEDPEVYEYMRSYSPYENLRDANYPPVLAVTSLNDTRVLYVEPAKWVAALREHAEHPETVLLRCEMAGGHGGASGRYSQWKDTAWEYAWLAEKLGVAG